MAGPSARVGIPAPLSVVERDSLDLMIVSISSQRKGNDFWVASSTSIGGRYAGEGRPFIVSMSESEEDLEQSESGLQIMEAAFGFRPMQQIGFIAMCNGDEDHLILGELCLWAADRFKGIVSFDGVLLPRLPLEVMKGIWNEPWQYAQPFHEEMIRPMPGRIVSLRYLTANGKTWVSHVADTAFMRAWLAHTDFHMIK